MKSPEMLAGSLQPGLESKRGYAGAWSGNGWFAPATKNPKSQLGSRAGENQSDMSVKSCGHGKPCSCGILLR